MSTVMSLPLSPPNLSGINWEVTSLGRPVYEGSGREFSTTEFAVDLGFIYAADYDTITSSVLWAYIEAKAQKSEETHSLAAFDKIKSP